MQHCCQNKGGCYITIQRDAILGTTQRKGGGGGLNVHLPKARISDRGQKPFTGKDWGVRMDSTLVE